MITGEAEKISADSHVQKVTQPLPINEGTSHMNALSATTLAITEEILARRKKNRERQRRYRAKKRLEAEVRRLGVLPQQALPPLGPQSPGRNIMLDHFAPPVSATTQAPITMQPCNSADSIRARIYSGRKWKSEARQVYISTREARSPGAIIPPPEVDSASRRDWKADARNNAEAIAREAGH